MATDAGRPGRPRDPSLDRAILRATIGVLAETSYADLTYEAVARRAGVHRPAVYRRWRTKAHLVTAALLSQFGQRPTPDTGDLRADLLVGIGSLERAFADPAVRTALIPLVSDFAGRPELRELFLTEFLHPRRATSERALRAAIDRGELRADLDMSYVLDALAAPFYYRLLLGHAPIDHALVETTVDSVLAALRPVGSDGASAPGRPPLRPGPG